TYPSYSQARDATYAPPQDRNLGVLPKPPKDKDAAYKTSAPVQDPRIARTNSSSHQTTDKPVASYADIIEDDTDEPPDVANSSSHIPPASQLVSNGQPLRPGVMVVPDPYETVLTVAKESHALRSINGLVDNKEDVEGIIDPGSQIISMSEESLGLVRNVPFQVSDIVLYLQIHVIRQAAYDILLGQSLYLPEYLSDGNSPDVAMRTPAIFKRRSQPLRHHETHDRNFTANSRI
ncbi:hypothetical protein A0H81_06725, partial [Grifola frondosa]